MRRLLTSDEVGEVLGRSPKWVLRNKHEIGWLAVGKRGVRFLDEDLDTFLDQARVPARR